VYVAAAYTPDDAARAGGARPRVVFSLSGLPLLSLREGLGRGGIATGLRHASRVGPLARDDAQPLCEDIVQKLSENGGVVRSR